jgi:hypothetical protein
MGPFTKAWLVARFLLQDPISVYNSPNRPHQNTLELQPILTISSLRSDRSRSSVRVSDRDFQERRLSAEATWVCGLHRHSPTVFAAQSEAEM